MVEVVVELVSTLLWYLKPPFANGLGLGLAVSPE